MTGTQIEKERPLVTRTEVSATQTWRTLNLWLFSQTIFQRDATERLESTKLAPRLLDKMHASTKRFPSWRFAQTTSLRVLERRESGSSEPRLLTTKPTREPWPSLTTTRENQCPTSKSRTGVMAILKILELTPPGRMTDTTQGSILIHIDMIMWTSQSKSIKMSSEEP